MRSPVHLITGGAGFIGSNLARTLIAQGKPVWLVDDLSRGSIGFIEDMLDDPLVQFSQLDCADGRAVAAAATSVGAQVSDIWHMAANSDIPAGVEDPAIDLNRTFLTTVGALETARILKSGVFHFASSSAIYGDFGDDAIAEDSGPLQPVSNYGAMKLASEAQISAAVEAFLPRSEVFRFPNVIGFPSTHGVIHDFVRELAATPDELQVLGDGNQRKPYLHVSDLVGAMLHIGRIEGRRVLFNIGPTDDGVTVRHIAETVRDHVAPAARIVFGASDRGWVGDVPRFRYSTERLAATGWRPLLSSSDAIARAVVEIAGQSADSGASLVSSVES